MVATMRSWADARKTKGHKQTGRSLSTHQILNPMSPHYIRSRNKRARAPKPIEHQGRLYDVMGGNEKGELLLRDRYAIHQDVRLEDFTGRLAMLDGACWQVMSLEALPGSKPLELVPVLQLVDPQHPSHTLTVSQADMPRVRFPSGNGEHRPGRIKHGIMRLVSTVPRTKTRLLLLPGQRFEARLRHRELQGPFEVEVGDNGQFTAEGWDHNGQPQRIAIAPTDIAPRYKRVSSLDFGTRFDVDTFVYREDQLRNQATNTWADPDGGPIQDPLFGTLPEGGTTIELTNGVDHLAVFEKFIRDHTQPSVATTVVETPRKLSMLNLSVSNQGDASCVVKALIEFRRQNPSAQIRIVASKLGTTEYQQSPEYRRYLDMLAENRIDVNDYTNVDGQTRQVMHGKAVIIDDHVLFSTGAVMDTQPINKADFSLELPHVAATAFRKYTEEAIHGDATLERRAELTAELAALGVVVNDPIAGLTYISRAQNALIRGAQHTLLISLSELVDPIVTKLLIQRAANGVQILIQVRELDHRSTQLLMKAMRQYPNIQLEDSSWWEPRPHWNAIVADGTSAYVGSSYLWSTQRNMVHQGRSFENGVLLNAEATDRVCSLINDLRSRNVVARTPDTFGRWSLQQRSCAKERLHHAENVFKRVLFNFSVLDAPFTCAKERRSNESQIDHNTSQLLQELVSLYHKVNLDHQRNGQIRADDGEFEDSIYPWRRALPLLE